MYKVVAALVYIGATGTAVPSPAQDALVVGVTAAMTGPLASAYGPVGDGMRVYIDKLNAAGGVNGKPVRLVIRDDQSDATKGAANVKRLIEEDNVQLLVNDSASTTYQPTMAEVRRSETPVLRATGYQACFTRFAISSTMLEACSGLSRKRVSLDLRPAS